MMYRAIFYKEWIKTWRVTGLMFLVFSCFIAYIFISTSQSFRVNGAVNTWEAVIMKDFPLFPAGMKWLPLLAAVLVSLAQYIPEMQNKRLKLTFHLPMKESCILSSMLLYGLMVLSILYILTAVCVLSGLKLYYPPEFISIAFATMLPWFLSGWTAYLLTAWICLEPAWNQRIINGIAAVCGLSFLFIHALSGGYEPFIPVLTVWLILVFTFPFYSASRFKDGIQ